MAFRKCEPSSDSTWWRGSYSSSLSIHSAACLRNIELPILPESATTGLSPTDHLQRSDCVMSHHSLIHLMFAELRIGPSRIQPDPSKSWISRVRTIKRSVQWDETWSLQQQGEAQRQAPDPDWDSLARLPERRQIERKCLYSRPSSCLLVWSSSIVLETQSGVSIFPQEHLLWDPCCPNPEVSCFPPAEGMLTTRQDCAGENRGVLVPMPVCASVTCSVYHVQVRPY